MPFKIPFYSLTERITLIEYCMQSIYVSGIIFMMDFWWKFCAVFSIYEVCIVLGRHPL